jgi:hypothetical protein
MTKTRNLSDLLDANGDVKLGNLDNVPASNDASALTTGTLPIARIADGDIALAKLSATGTKDATTFLRGDNTFAEAGGGGKVLQVITATDSTQRTTTSTSYTKAGNTLDVVITPSATSSKLLLMYTGEFSTDGSSVFIGTIFRDTTNLETSSDQGFRAANVTENSAWSVIYLDSPSTTSEITYSIQFRGNAGTTVRLASGNRPHSFTVMEIGA